jgi:hypothetical protein
MRVVRILMLLESTVNLVSGLVYMFHPSLLVADMLRPELVSSFANSSEAAVWSLFGTTVVSQGVVLARGAFGDVHAAKTAYLMLIVGELLIVPLSIRYVNT